MSFTTLSTTEMISAIEKKFLLKSLSGFLIFTSVTIGLLWLSIVIPPALDGSVPVETEHYTTLVVQALDLSILLPASFISGVLLIKRNPYGYKLASVYIIFLAILMTALTAKVIAMRSLGYNVIPVIFIIPVFNACALVLAGITVKSFNKSRA
jgi:hypothetical protein